MDKSKYQFGEEIQELLRIPRLVFVVLSFLIGFIKLDRSQYIEMLKELDGEWLNYLLLMGARDTFHEESKPERSAKLALSFVCIKKELKDNLTVEPYKINEFLKEIKEKDSDCVLNLIRENAECISLFEEVEKSFNDYQNRDDGFYKEFREVAINNVAGFGSLFLNERYNKMRHFN